MNETVKSVEDFGQRDERFPPCGELFLVFFLVMYFLMTTYFYAFIGMFMSPVVSLGIFVPIAYFFFVSIVERKYFVVTVFCAICAFVLLQMYQFSQVARFGFDPTSLAQLYGPLSFVIAWYFVDTPMQRRCLDILYMCCLIYAGVYCFLVLIVTPSVVATVLSPDARYFLIRPDFVRGDRIAFAGSTAIFAFFHGIDRVRWTKQPVDIAAVLVTGCACFLTQGRLMAGLLVLFTAGYFFVRTKRSLAWATAVVFVFCTAGMIYGLLDPNYNPFVLVGDDSLNSVRADSYDLARYYIAQHPILGVGFDVKLQNSVDFTGSTAFSPSDLGPIGIYYQFGAAGVILYIASALIAILASSGDKTDSNENGAALLLTGCFIGLSAFLSPTLWIGDGSMFFGIIFALALKRLRINWSDRPVNETPQPT